MCDYSTFSFCVKELLQQITHNQALNKGKCTLSLNVRIGVLSATGTHCQAKGCLIKTSEAAARYLQ